MGNHEFQPRLPRPSTAPTPHTSSPLESEYPSGLQHAATWPNCQCALPSRTPNRSQQPRTVRIYFRSLDFVKKTPGLSHIAKRFDQVLHFAKVVDGGVEVFGGKPFLEHQTKSAVQKLRHWAVGIFDPGVDPDDPRAAVTLIELKKRMPFIPVAQESQTTVSDIISQGFQPWASDTKCKGSTTLNDKQIGEIGHRVLSGLETYTPWGENCHKFALLVMALVVDCPSDALRRKCQKRCNLHRKMKS
ncbi:hypothetical protein FN846DRAFT_943557 [Sphaerosporella brunnea]|uniref:Uncharacterized protein n=1 Tax=Sphaerosporella brunnea TaxID=1250544 RepID=A0A5J5F0T8_9PEZI|nr:hypothetical protein FN846DRAFT_943557 [Sphaerosporella brunnea]